MIVFIIFISIFSNVVAERARLLSGQTHTSQHFHAVVELPVLSNITVKYKCCEPGQYCAHLNWTETVEDVQTNNQFLITKPYANASVYFIEHNSTKQCTHLITSITHDSHTISEESYMCPTDSYINNNNTCNKFTVCTNSTIEIKAPTLTSDRQCQSTLSCTCGDLRKMYHGCNCGQLPTYVDCILTSTNRECDDIKNSFDVQCSQSC